MKFTDRSIKSLKAERKRYEAWEDNGKGFGIRVAPSGRKSWVYLYRFGGTARRITFGTYPAISLSGAHVKRAKAREDLEKGIDPGLELIAVKQSERDADIFAELAEEYLEKYAKPRKRSANEDERILRKDVIPVWGRRKAKDIRRRDVIALLDEIVERGSPIIANRTLAVIRKLYNWAMSRDIVDATPCAAIQAPSKENRRDRVLSDSEIKTFWTKLEEAKMSEGSKLALRLQLVTAQRKGEILSAAWSDLDLDDTVWTIPAEKSKNGLPHRVPLTDMAVELLSAIKEESGESRWLFPSAIYSNRHVTETSVNHALRLNLDVFGLEPFTPHDLRRTTASHMASGGVSRLVISKVLNHAESGITAVYDRHSYDKEKRMALEAWGRKLESILTGKKAKVVPLVKAK